MQLRQPSAQKKKKKAMVRSAKCRSSLAFLLEGELMKQFPQ